MIRIKGKKDNPMGLEDKKFESYFHRAHHLAEELVSTYGKNLSLDENGEFNTFLKENHLSGKLVDRLTSAEIHREYYDRLAQEDQEKNLALLLERMREKKPKQKKLRIWYRVAASVAATVAFVFWLISEQKEEKYDDWYSQVVTEQYTQPTLILENDSSLILADYAREAIVNRDYEIEKLQENMLKYTTTGQSGSLRYNKLIVPRKYTYTLKFSDGTEVILNAGSILRYPVDFAGDKREVELVGEAFFKVAKSDKPFLVRMGENNITVYGTQFNVYSRENHDLEIVLVEGSIGFKASNQKEIKIKPSQMVVRQFENGEIRVKEVNPKDYIMWVENMFVFKGQTLGRIMSELSIWYGVQIKVRPDQENTKLTLITNKDNSLDEVFKFITEITGVEIIKIGNMEYRTE
ncbi:MAG TPA: FecR domain-containing protein [Butyricimonas virosa]|uniref:FecR domain-containing protein n=1 Tax=Butyricimonas virosa TaxID=544645 RepID=A0A921H1L1_9BACT|nr:FecR domain-containing protein [Butyricimonas virosa]